MHKLYAKPLLPLHTVKTHRLPLSFLSSVDRAAVWLPGSGYWQVKQRGRGGNKCLHFSLIRNKGFTVLLLIGEPLESKSKYTLPIKVGWILGQEF